MERILRKSGALLVEENEEGKILFSDVEERNTAHAGRYAEYPFAAECAIEIRNTFPYSEFEEEFGREGNYAMYTNAYSDIKIMAITAEKKKTIFSAETQ